MHIFEKEIPNSIYVKSLAKNSTYSRVILNYCISNNYCRLLEREFSPEKGELGKSETAFVSAASSLMVC